ncbi:MAG: serpin family protein [Bacteroidota bacterium]
MRPRRGARRAPDQDLADINASYQSLRSQLLEADPEVQLAIANAMFYNTDRIAADGFGPSFLSAMQDDFDAEIDGFSFTLPEALDAINGWASDNTNGRVPEVLADLDPGLVLLLMNAVYFKGDWTTPFDTDETAPRPFTLADGTTVDVPTMSGLLPALAVYGDGYRAVELPYGRRNFSMVLLLPDEGPLAGFTAQLNAGLWADATAQLDARTDWGEVQVAFPRFSFGTDKRLNEILQAMGMTDAFTDVADLSRMRPGGGLLVDFVKQNTFVEVNEEGTEAAAVTTIGVRETSVGPVFTADRPFVFAIRERTTNTLLFIGQMADPRS